jgi:hypothetical protein
MVSTLLVLIILAFAKSNASGCSQSKYCTPGGWCENFTSLIELNSALQDKSLCVGYFETDDNNCNCSISINIKANNYKGPLNDRFDYQTFIQTIFPLPRGQVFNLNFYGFNGIDFNFTIAKYFTSNITVIFSFTFTKFDFYLNGNLWEMNSNEHSSCNDTQLINIFNETKYGLFGLSTSLYINFELHSPNSNFKKWCPLIFKNSNTVLLQINGKPIRFYTGNSSYNQSNIQTLYFNNLVVDNLDKEILHPQVYSSLNQIWITGSVKKIETDVFKELKNVRNIYFKINDFKGFIHGNGIEWMNYVNYYAPPFNMSRFELECGFECMELLSSSVTWIGLENTSVNRSNSFDSFPYFPNLKSYAFPEQDFCIFSNYPHDRSVLVGLKDNYLLNCTCTMIWMSKNAALLTTLNTPSSYNPLCLSLISNNVTFKQAFDACGFPDKYEKCQMNMASLNKSLASYTDSYFQFYDAQYVFIEIRDILKNYFDYWVLVVGFLANLITVIVIINAYRKASAYSNNKDNQLGSIKENFFTYMLINSVINSIYCLIMFFNEVLPCVPNPVGEKYIENNCLITDVCIATTTSVLKLTANVTYLQMSLNGYLLVGKDHSERLKSIGKANIAVVLIIAIISSLLLSYVVVEQEIFLNYLVEQPYGLQLNDYFVSTYMFYFSDFSYYDLFVQKLENKLPLIIALTIIHDLVSYFLFVILNLIVDVMTVVKLKETLGNKARLGVQSKAKKEEQERAERRSIIMVVLNSLVNILLRIPELLSIIFFFIIHSNAFMLRKCSTVRECRVVTQISDSFFNFTMICSIFFYYFFNKTFKFAFHLIISLDSKKNKPSK